MSTPWDEFARICADVLKVKGEVRPITLDEKRDRLVVGEPGGPISFVHLMHARTEWEAAPLGARPRVLHRRFWSSIRNDTTATKEQVLRGVLPRVRDRAWFSAVRRQAELELGADETAIDEVMLPFAAINEELAAHLAYELPSSVTEIGPDRLKAWGMTFDQLLERAKDNLREASQAPWEEATPGVFVSPFHDSLDATRIVLPELFTSMALKGKPVFIAPTHDIVFVTGDDDPEGLQQIAVWTEEALLEPRAHTAIAFRLVTASGNAGCPRRATRRSPSSSCWRCRPPRLLIRGRRKCSKRCSNRMGTRFSWPRCVHFARQPVTSSRPAPGRTGSRRSCPRPIASTSCGQAPGTRPLQRRCGAPPSRSPARPSVS